MENSTVFQPSCFPVIVIGSSSFVAAIFMIFLAFFFTCCKSNKLPKDATLIHNVTEFQNLITSDGENALMIPFQMAKFGFLRLYTHHILVTGYARKSDGDFLLTTVEYTGGGRWRGWGKLCHATIDCVWSLHRFYRHIWGRVKVRVLLLSEEVSEKKPILLLRYDDHDFAQQYSPCPNTIANLDEAKRLLWDQERIEKLLNRDYDSTLELEPITGDGQKARKFELLRRRMEENRRNDAAFFTVAARLKPILHETNWSAIFNSCEHLVNYLLSGRHWSRQLAEAHFFRLLLLHIIGPMLEFVWIFRISAAVPHLAAIFCGSLVDNEHMRYAISIFFVYLFEFWPAAWVISGMVGLEAQGRTASCVKVVLEAFAKSTLNTAAISLGCLLGHWSFSCLPSIWDEAVVSSAFLIVAHFVIFPLFAALYDIVLRHARLLSLARLVTISLIHALPVILVSPYFFDVIRFLRNPRNESSGANFSAGDRDCRAGKCML